ncbi:hypothetical protein DFP74_0635 [Nocardiopsis sp. Huas11]|nr:hypothetical protein DFP74_0635 [Nocardiopsis sp. Huas11]
MALEASTGGDPGRRDLAAEVLGDVLRGAMLDAATARLVVGRLVALAVGDSVAGVREAALNALCEASSRYSLPWELVEPLDAAMARLEPELITYVLCVFGATHDLRARPLIEPFLRHPHPDVREEARLADAEITMSNTPGGASPGSA